MTIFIGIIIGIIMFVVIFIIELKAETKNQKYMGKTDFTYYRGVYCPNRKLYKRFDMNVQRLPTGFRLDNMSEDDLRSLREIIKGAGLVERRHWNRTLTELNEILK